MKVKRNRFDNRCMTPRNERKPHLVLMQAFGVLALSPARRIPARPSKGCGRRRIIGPTNATLNSTGVRK